MQPILLGAFAPSFRSLLSLAMMPLSLLLACALVAGLGAVMLLASRASVNSEQPEPAVVRQEAPESLAFQQPAVPRESARKTTGEFIERRGGSSAHSPEPLDSGDTAVSTSIAVSAGETAHIAPGLRTPSAPPERRVSRSLQLGGRYSRSQQAFLRIPVVLSSRSDSGVEVREETCTLILLPQGAVVPVSRRISAGAPLTLSLPGKEPVTCSVFGAQTGPDGKSLVEIEFSAQQKNFWPVSFPAWAGELPAGMDRKGSAAPLRAAHTAVLSESES